MPAVQFVPPIDSSLAGLQVYPVLVVPETPGTANIPKIYVSIYLRDCSEVYSAAQIVSIDVQIPENSRKVSFKIKQANNDGAFLKPELIQPGMSEDTLSEEGKKMLRTKETYFLAEIESAGDDQKSLSRYATVQLHLKVNLSQENGVNAKTIDQTFTLKQEKLELQVVSYSNGDQPINQSVVIPPIPAGCVQD